MVGMDTMTKDEALAYVRGAFPTTTIDARGAFEAWGTTYPDADAYAQHLDGKQWDRLDRAYLMRRSDALGFLSTRHLVAVLPVYLQSMIEEGVWSGAAGMLTTILMNPDAGADTGLGHDRFAALDGALSDAQRQAIAAALQTLATDDAEGSLGIAARAALDSHWRRHLRTSNQAVDPS
jgi:hypothetical protein